MAITELIIRVFFQEIGIKHNNNSHTMLKIKLIAIFNLKTSDLMLLIKQFEQDTFYKANVRLIHPYIEETKPYVFGKVIQ